MSSAFDCYYVQGTTLAKTDDPSVVEDLVERGEPVWIDLHTSDATSNALLEKVLSLHPLTIEDIWNEQVSPKIEKFDAYLYIRVHSVRTNGSDEAKIELLELDIVLGEKFLVTHDPAGQCAVQAVREELTRSTRALSKGPAWIAHGLLDHAIDPYLSVTSHLDVDIEALENDVITKDDATSSKSVLERIFGTKRRLQSLHRFAVRQREILLRLSRGEFEEIPPEALPFFRDVHDHFARVTDLVDSYRELVGSVLEVYLSVQSNHMNQIMKTLTLMSTIMLPLTFIAGVYGMNFEHMPELHWVYGYPFALLLMAGVAVGIVLWLRVRRWL